MSHDPETQRAIDGRRADTDRQLAAWRKFAKDDPDALAELDKLEEKIADSREQNP